MEKYYTPSIEDLHIGYECECLWQEPDPRTWNKIDITETDTQEYLKLSIEDVISRLRSGEIRTPYLTHKQIEKEGWEIKDLFNDGMTHTYPSSFKAEKKVTGATYELSWRNMFGPVYFDIKVHIQYPKISKTYNVFIGNLQSINEFRKLCKLLSI